MVAIYSEMVPFCTNRTKWNHSRPNTASPLSRRAETARPAGGRYAFFLNSEGVSSKWRLKQMLKYFGLAKPVMIDPRYYKNYRSGVLKVSLAGPGGNLLLCFISIFLMGLLQRFGMLGMGGYQFLYWIMLYNVWFAFFNLIPVPPLDGSKVVSMLLPGELSWKFENFNAQYGFIILMVVVFSGVANKFLSPLSNLFVTLCYNITYILL